MGEVSSLFLEEQLTDPLLGATRLPSHIDTYAESRYRSRLFRILLHVEGQTWGLRYGFLCKWRQDAILGSPS